MIIDPLCLPFKPDTLKQHFLVPSAIEADCH